MVTGAGSGIGRATTIRMAQEGATVVGVDVNSAGLDELRSEADVTTMVADVTSQDDIDRIVADTLGAHGKIDILANVAGIMDWFLPVAEVDDETWDRVMAVNATGPLKLSRAVLPAMLEQHAGAIVNVGSAASLRGGTAGVSYNARRVERCPCRSPFRSGPSDATRGGRLRPAPARSATHGGLRRVCSEDPRRGTRLHPLPLAERVRGPRRLDRGIRLSGVRPPADRGRQVRVRSPRAVPGHAGIDFDTHDNIFASCEDWAASTGGGEDHDH